jgi:hypothetical protein
VRSAYAAELLGAACWVRLVELPAARGLRTSRASSLQPKASAYLVSVASDSECLPLPHSIRATADCVVPIFSAICAWVRPCDVQVFKNSSKKENSSLSLSNSALTATSASAWVRSCLCVSMFPLLHSFACKRQVFGRCSGGLLNKLMEHRNSTLTPIIPTQNSGQAGNIFSIVNLFVSITTQVKLLG